jgi:hypothetical protein
MNRSAKITVPGAGIHKERSRHDIATKQFLHPTKPFCCFDANVLKPLAGTDLVNDALNWRDRAPNRGRQCSTHSG